MPWVSFTVDWFWSPPHLKGRWSRLYRKGTLHLVTRDCAAQAVGRKVGQIVERPPRLDDREAARMESP